MPSSVYSLSPELYQCECHTKGSCTTVACTATGVSLEGASCPIGLSVFSQLICVRGVVGQLLAWRNSPRAVIMYTQYSGAHLSGLY